MKGEERKRLMTKYGAWAAKKYGSLDKAKEAWGGTKCDGDDLANGVAGFMHMWFNSDQTGGRLRRLADTLQFFSETMYAFNKDIARFVRKDLGCKMLINAGHWHTANNLLMLDAEHWSYRERHHRDELLRQSGVHINPTENHKTGWLVSRATLLQDGSILLMPRRLATNRKQVAGFPF